MINPNDLNRYICEIKEISQLSSRLPRSAFKYLISSDLNYLLLKLRVLTLFARIVEMIAGKCFTAKTNFSPYTLGKQPRSNRILTPLLNLPFQVTPGI